MTLSVKTMLLGAGALLLAIVDADLAIARAHAHAQVTQILTPDQKAQLKALTETRRRR